MRRLLVATTNRDKLAEIAPILDGIPYELVTLADFPGVDAPDETGRTFAENARAKAEYYSLATGELTVAEDSGLEIDALDGLPGVESARYGGVSATYPQKFSLIYDALRAKNAAESAARFVCAVAVVKERELVYEVQGAVEGRIIASQAPRGSSGFGYDPIFYYPPFGLTLAEAGGRKSAVSHRGAAFRALRAFLSSNRPL